MENLQNVLCAVGGLALGTLGAYITYRVSRRTANAESVTAVMGTNVLRMLIDIAALVLAYFACRLFSLPATVTLVSVAMGLTVFGMLFLKKLTKELNADTESKDGGE